jgi:hypothetical protein
MSRRPDPGTQLLRALARSATAAGAPVTLHHDALAPWASATFVGGQHRVIAEGAAPDWVAGLPTAELPLIGHYVAGLTVEPTAHGGVLTALVLEE